MASDEITNEIILEHLQSMKLDFGKKFDSIDLRFDKMEKRFGKMEKRFDKFDERMGTAEKHLDGIDIALQRLYERRVGLTQRVDHIEKEELPRIKQHVGMA